MRQKAYFYPPRPRNGYDNPYALNFKATLAAKFEVAEADNQPVKGQLLSLLHHALSSDVFLLNWIENVGVARNPWLRSWIALFCLNMMKWRGKKMVWVLHNIHPHEGENECTRMLKKWLFRHAHLIIAHSHDAEAYARKHARGKVLFCHHPVTPITIKGEVKPTTATDVFIWGSILPYKGVKEFVALPQLQASKLNVRILGHCPDPTLADEINQHCNERVVFENRKAPFEEIAAYIKTSHYVLFPYTDSAFSSSGALIDTLSLGGTPVAPHTGCFKDLQQEGLCITYNSQDELFDILNTRTRTIDHDKVESFINSNSWEKFIDKIDEHLK